MHLDAERYWSPQTWVDLGSSTWKSHKQCHASCWLLRHTGSALGGLTQPKGSGGRGMGGGGGAPSGGEGVWHAQGTLGSGGWHA